MAKVLPITIYLNQRAVFDLLAIIEDGFSEMRSVESARTSADKAEINGGIGVSNVFSLLSVKLGLGQSKETADQRTEREDRVHTPTSLFAKLHSYLVETGQVKEISSIDLMNAKGVGSFVSFQATLQRNPIISMIDSILQFGTMAMQMEGGKKTKGKPKNDSELVMRQLRAMKEALEHEDSFDLICTLSTGQMQAVMPVYLDYFVNRNLNELVDGEYTIFGKVVQVVREGETFSLDA